MFCVLASKNKLRSRILNRKEASGHVEEKLVTQEMARIAVFTLNKKEVAIWTYFVLFRSKSTYFSGSRQHRQLVTPTSSALPAGRALAR